MLKVSKDDSLAVAQIIILTIYNTSLTMISDESVVFEHNERCFSGLRRKTKNLDENFFSKLSGQARNAAITLAIAIISLSRRVSGQAPDKINAITLLNSMISMICNVFGSSLVRRNP
jgi:hypothetical protein